MPDTLDLSGRLLRASALPQAADGEVERLRRRFGRAPPPAPGPARRR